jgi:dTDP-6-deoxy-L-talose 4-dehydrogenase (NAD+)
VYGPVHASDTPRPNNSYGIAKHLLHQLLRAAQRHLAFELVWARLFYLYGAGDDPRSLLATFDRALENGDQSFNMSYGEQLYDFSPVEHGADQIVALITFPNGIYNVCSGKPISLRRLLELRMREKQRHIELNLGFYPYRAHDSIALWGADPVSPRLVDNTHGVRR